MKWFSLLLLLALQLQGSTDPYLWLEDDSSPQTIEWLQEQQARCDAYYTDEALRTQIKKDLERLLDFDTVSVPVKRGDTLFYHARRAGDPQACLFKNKGELLVDPTVFSPDGTASIHGFVVSRDGSLLAYGISRCGSDWKEWRIKKVASGEDFPEVLLGMKSHLPEWDAASEGLYYFKFSSDKATQAYSEEHDLYYHRLGAACAEDRRLLEYSEPGVLFGSLHATDEGRYLLFSKHVGTDDCNGVVIADLAHGNGFAELFPLGSNSYDYFGSEEGRLYFVTNDGAPKGRVISIDPLNPQDPQEHIQEGDAYIDHACLVKDAIVVSSLEDAHSRIDIFDRMGKLLHRVSLPGLGTAGSRWRSWSLSGDSAAPEFFYPYIDFTHPITVFACNAATGVSELFAASKISWEPEDYAVQQIFYPSKDGTKIPMFLLHRSDVALDGKRPTLLYGYGGFNIPLTLSFSAATLEWLNLGGVYAIANLRGGGEYGEEWHRAGRLAAKQNVFDDFIAAAEWLVGNGITEPSKLAIHGRSNGGLLVGACMTQRPDLFGAAMADVGVLDMLRYHLFTVGWSWMVEYGSPDKPDEAAVLRAYSPLHNVQKGRAYPATLITTSDHDNRVVPLHSYKFAAALQEAQAGKPPILLRVYRNAGHGAGRSKAQLIDEEVDHLLFLLQELFP